jgi:hypothetical protein
MFWMISDAMQGEQVKKARCNAALAKRDIAAKQ